MFPQMFLLPVLKPGELKLNYPLWSCSVSLWFDFQVVPSNQMFSQMFQLTISRPDFFIAIFEARRVTAQLPTLELFCKIVVRLSSRPIKSELRQHGLRLYGGLL